MCASKARSQPFATLLPKSFSPPTDAAAVVAMTPVATHAAATAMAIVAMKAAAADIDSIIS